MERKRVIYLGGRKVETVVTGALKIPVREVGLLLHFFFFWCVTSRCFLQLKLREVSLPAFILVLWF